MAAVGRLLLGEIRDWSEFLAADADVTALPRRVLRTAKHDVYRRLRPEAKRFFERSFEGMTGAVLSRLYDAIRHNQGLEMPLGQFEREYAGISPIALKDAPAHATVKISLWGLQFEFPELHLSKDVREALRAARKAQAALAKWRAKRHSEVVTAKTEIGGLIRTQLFASRSCVLASTHLVEAFLNGVAWDFAQDSDVLSNLTERDRRLVVEQSCSLRKKLERYPQIIAGRPLWRENDEDLKAFERLKPFRDSLVHASPFSAPQRFGGYDKLRHLYRVDVRLAEEAARLAVRIISRVHAHLKPDVEGLQWLQSLASEVGEAAASTEE